MASFPLTYFVLLNKKKKEEISHLVSIDPDLLKVHFSGLIDCCSVGILRFTLPCKDGFIPETQGTLVCPLNSNVV